MQDKEKSGWIERINQKFVKSNDRFKWFHATNLNYLFECKINHSLFVHSYDISFDCWWQFQLVGGPRVCMCESHWTCDWTMCVCVCFLLYKVYNFNAFIYLSIMKCAVWIRNFWKWTKTIRLFEDNECTVRE